MKKMLLMAAILGGTAAMSAQVAMVKPKFTDNWSIGLDGGVTTPLNNGAFFGNMRGVAGLHIQKQITPAFGVGAEGLWGVNTSSWRGMERSKTAFDSQYVGVYGAVNLFDLFSSNYNLGGRVFDIEAQAGAGWGHLFQSAYSGKGETKDPKDANFFATKAGLNFNFHPSQRVTLSLKPSVLWNMTGEPTAAQTSANYDSRKATFNLLASVSVALGKGFEYVVPNYNLDEIAALNDQVNSLKADLNGAANALTTANAANKKLAEEVNMLKNQKPEVVKTTTTNDYLQSVRYVNFALGRYNVPADQLPNVAAVASYLKNQPKSTVVIKGYASADGPIEVNERLARQRAESVRDMLVKKYGIAADRIKAEGEGIGHMFEEESWNRVAICTLDNNAPVSSDSKTVVKK